MPHSLNRIFTAGIVWDPREPLPAELQAHRSSAGGYGVDRSMRMADNTEYTEAFRFINDEFGQNQLQIDRSLAQPKPVTQPGARGVRGTSTWPMQGATKRVLPRYTVQEPGRNVLPPLSIIVDASIIQDTAKVAVTQLFWNDSSVPIKEAAFTFPLPAGCTVTDFSCRVGTNKIIKGTIKPRDEAREKFEKHIRQHNTAAGLLEQDTPEIFTTTLGNIPENTKIKVNLTYITLLKHRFADSSNVTTLTIPTFIAPRYGDEPAEYNDAATTEVKRGLTFEAEIIESERITSIMSPSHSIAVERRQGTREAESFADLAGDDGRSSVETAAVKLDSGPMFLEKDFVLDIATTPDGALENPRAWLEEHPTLANHKALMLTLPSEFLNRNSIPVEPSEILFLADLSGSMSDKIASLKSAMQFFLKGIPQGRKFNIWCFGSDYKFWQPESVEYGEGTLQSALQWVDMAFNADMGGTELLPALRAIVSARDRKLMTDVIVLTDGEVWRMDETIEFVRKTRLSTATQVRFFSLGIGRAVSHALVDGIAKAGGGYAEVVQEASQGGWEDRVVSMAKAALMSAHLGPIHVEFEIQGEGGKMRISTLADGKRSPADVSVLSPFERNRIYFLFSSESLINSESIKSVKIELAFNNDTKSLTIPVIVLERPDTTIHKLAARSMLDDLERGRGHIHLGPSRPYPGSWGEINAVRKEAEEIACKWFLVSKWTSFFLAEEPYAPKEKDPFMDSVTEVKEAPGQDLLEPRDPIVNTGTVRSAGELPPDASADLLGDFALAPPDGVQGASDPILDEMVGWATPSASSISTVSSSTFSFNGGVGGLVEPARAPSGGMYSGPSVKSITSPRAPFHIPSPPPLRYYPTTGVAAAASPPPMRPPAGFCSGFPPVHKTAQRARAFTPPGDEGRTILGSSHPMAFPPPPPGPPSLFESLDYYGPTPAGASPGGVWIPPASDPPAPGCGIDTTNAPVSQLPTNTTTKRHRYQGPTHVWPKSSSEAYTPQGDTTGDTTKSGTAPPTDALYGRHSFSATYIPQGDTTGDTLQKTRRIRSRDHEPHVSDRRKKPSLPHISLGGTTSTSTPSLSPNRFRTLLDPNLEHEAAAPSHQIHKVGRTKVSTPPEENRTMPGYPVTSPTPPPPLRSQDYYGPAPAQPSSYFWTSPPSITPLPSNCVMAPAPAQPFAGPSSPKEENEESKGPFSGQTKRFSVTLMPEEDDPWKLSHSQPVQKARTTEPDDQLYGQPKAALGGSESLIDPLEPTHFYGSDTMSPAYYSFDSLVDSAASEAAPPLDNTLAFEDTLFSSPPIRKHPTEREFIDAMLEFQRYDGAIDFGKFQVASKWLGNDVEKAMLQFPIRAVPLLTLWTAAVYVLLERDFQSFKALWELMAIKMAKYCAEHPMPDRRDVIEEVRRRIEGLEVPVYREGRLQAKRPAETERMTAGVVAAKVPKVESEQFETENGPALEDDSDDATMTEHQDSPDTKKRRPPTKTVSFHSAQVNIDLESEDSDLEKEMRAFPEQTQEKVRITEKALETPDSPAEEHEAKVPHKTGISRRLTKSIAKGVRMLRLDRRRKEGELVPKAGPSGSQVDPVMVKGLFSGAMTGGKTRCR